MLRYAITDRARILGDEATRHAALLKQAASLASHGAEFLQLREKDLEAAALATLARDLLVTLRAHSPSVEKIPKLLINSRADIALATRAPGVHLTSTPGALACAQIRRLYAASNLPAPIISLSCHNLAEVTRAAADPANTPTLILFGPVLEKVVFEKVISSQDQANLHLAAGTGLDLLRTACLTAAPIPVLALGGITAENTPACLAAGAAGIAAIRLFQTNHRG